MPFNGPWIVTDYGEAHKATDIKESLSLLVKELRRVVDSGHTISPHPGYIYDSRQCSVCREELRFCGAIWWMYMQPICPRCFPLPEREKRAK